MKKQKLTPEEKAENKLIKKQWAEFIRRMAKKGAIVTAILLILSSCSVKRYSYEAVNLQPGEIEKNHVRCNVAEIKRTMQGYKHTLVTDKSDTIYRTYQRPLELNHCYYIWKTRLEKDL